MNDGTWSPSADMNTKFFNPDHFNDHRITLYYWWSFDSTMQHDETRASSLTPVDGFVAPPASLLNFAIFTFAWPFNFSMNCGHSQYWQTINVRIHIVYLSDKQSTVQSPHCCQMHQCKTQRRLSLWAHSSNPHKARSPIHLLVVISQSIANESEELRDNGSHSHTPFSHVTWFTQPGAYPSIGWVGGPLRLIEVTSSPRLSALLATFCPMYLLVRKERELSIQTFRYEKTINVKEFAPISSEHNDLFG